MPFCPNCGAKVDDGAKFCPGCGKPLQGDAPAEKPAATTPPVRNVEKKTMRFAPADEETVLAELAAFGWKLVSRNEVYSSHQEFDSAYTVGYGNYSNTTVNLRTVTTNYVSAVFERVPDEIPHYKEIAALGKEYDEAGAYVEKDIGFITSWSRKFSEARQGKAFVYGLGIAFMILGAFFMALGPLIGGSYWTIPFFLGLPFFIAGVIMFPIGLKFKLDYSKEQKKQIADLQDLIITFRNRQLNAVKKARELLK